RDRHEQGQGLPGPGAPAPLHARREVARLGPPAPSGLGGLGHDAGPRSQGTAHGRAPGRRPRDREEPRGLEERRRARAARPLRCGPRAAQRDRHGEESLMPAKKNEPANTKAKAAAPKASKADTLKAEANAKAAAKATAAKATEAKKSPTGERTSAKATDSGSDKRKIQKPAAAPARRAVARPVTRVARPAAPRAARPSEEPKRAKREAAPSKPLPTAPQGHAPLIAADGSSSGSVELPAVFTKVRQNAATLFQAFLTERANARQATSATKNRARVAGGGRKPWRQKGTGRARQGSIRAPQWRHGGVVFGPNGRQYWQRIPEKVRKAAFADAMSARVAEGRLLVVEGL